MTTLQISVNVMAQERNILTVIGMLLFFNLIHCLIVHSYCMCTSQLILTVTVIYTSISQGEWPLIIQRGLYMCRDMQVVT